MLRAAIAYVCGFLTMILLEKILDRAERIIIGAQDSLENTDKDDV